MTCRARSIEKSVGFRVGKKCGDLRGNVRSREGLRGGAEFSHEPVEENIPICIRKRNTRTFMLGLEERLPSGSVQGKKSIIVDTVACGAVLAYDLPHWTVGPGHLRPRWPSSDLGGQRRDEWRRQRGRDDCPSPPHHQFSLTPLAGVP